MKFVFASDSFKGSLTAVEIARMLDIAARAHFPDADTVLAPVADGGEGTVDALSLAMGGESREVIVTGPLGKQATARYCVADGGQTAVLEMAQASGLPLARENDPMRASSFGTGELLSRAAMDGARRILLGIGGSATNDCGMGMLAALGARFFDENGETLTPCGAALARVARADLSGLLPALKALQIDVLCDVDNPLLGERGATAVYGPQKGVSPDMMPILENGMRHFADILEDTLGRDIASIPGAGAAGGVGAALAGVLGARMLPGIDAVLDAMCFDDLIADADIVFTGEGRIDSQSIRYGKVPAGVAKRCARAGIPVVAIVGGMGEGAEGLYALADSGIITTVNAPMSVSDAIENAYAFYASAADRAFRLLKIGMRLR